MTVPAPNSPPRHAPGTILAGALAAVVATAALVGPWEGRRLSPYKDIVGVWTWCNGETAGIRKDRYTEAECDALLYDSTAKHLRGVAKCVNVPLSQNQWIAVGSWSFNVGVRAACGSSLVRKINAGLPAAMWCRDLLKWDYAGGKRVRGLSLRRQSEYEVCVKP